jgi:hypothetical protein
MRLPRMTTRRWIVVMATIGIFLGGLILQRRSDYFRARASVFAEMERGCAGTAIYFEGLAKRGRSTEYASDAERLRSQAEWYAKLKREFLRAADRPWALDPPDPIPEVIYVE